MAKIITDHDVAIWVGDALGSFIDDYDVPGIVAARL